MSINPYLSRRQMLQRTAAGFGSAALAVLQMHTGNVQPVRPSLGSWLLYGLGSEHENLPGYVVLRPSNQIVVGPALWSNCFLPAQYQATSVNTADMHVDKLLANIKN